MKKVSFWILALILAIPCFIACQKDGIYNPKQKITKLSMEKVRYHGGDQIGEKEYRNEYWKWEDKLLKSIKRETADGAETAVMTYDKKTIKSVDMGDKKITFSYKNGKIDKIELKEGDVCEKISVEVRDKGDMVQLRYEMSGNSMTNKSGFEQTVSDLFTVNQIIMPSYSAQMMQNSFIERKNAMIGSKADIVVVVSLQYNSKNIGKQTIEYISTDTTKEVYRYTYDTKKNPFYHSFMELLEVKGVPIFCSENNIVSSYEESNDAVITKYTYKYDKNDFPVSCEIKTTYDPAFPSLHYSLEVWEYGY